MSSLNHMNSLTLLERHLVSTRDDQHEKDILLQEKSSGHLYEGKAVRQLLGLTKGSFDWNIQPSNFDSCISEFF